MIILGIGGLGGDAAAAVLKDGELAAAVEESKLVRRRTHWGGRDEMPDRAIAACLEMAGATPDQVDAVAVVRPFPSNEFHLRLRAKFPRSRVVVVEHHLAHAASAYLCSPFDEATVLTLDRGGDFRSGSRWHASGPTLTLEQEHYAPDSIGDLFGRVTELLGFESSVDEHKVQWLSVTGDDRYRDLFTEILNLTPDGPRIDRSFFSTERTGRWWIRAALLRTHRTQPGTGAPGGWIAARRRGRGHPNCGSRDQPLHRRRPRAQRAVDFGAGEPLRIPQRFRAAGRGKRGHRHRGGAAHRPARDSAANPEPRAGLRRGRYQAGAWRTASSGSATW